MPRTIDYYFSMVEPLGLYRPPPRSWTIAGAARLDVNYKPVFLGTRLRADRRPAACRSAIRRGSAIGLVELQRWRERRGATAPLPHHPIAGGATDASAPFALASGDASATARRRRAAAARPDSTSCACRVSGLRLDGELGGRSAPGLALPARREVTSRRRARPTIDDCPTTYFTPPRRGCAPLREERAQRRGLQRLVEHVHARGGGRARAPPGERSAVTRTAGTARSRARGAAPR